MAKDNPYKFVLYLAGITGAIRIYDVMRSKPKISKSTNNLDTYKSSYYFDCTTFKILDQEKFAKFNDIITEKVFKGMGGTAEKLLGFSNYVIGFGQKYMQQISDLQAVSCNLAMEKVKIVYFILVRDALVSLKKVLQPTEHNQFDEVIGVYIDIWMQYLKIPKEESILQDIADRLKVYRETGVI